MGFSRQEYWSGLPFPPPGNLPDPGNKLVSAILAGRFFTTETPGKPECDSLYDAFRCLHSDSWLWDEACNRLVSLQKEPLLL